MNNIFDGFFEFKNGHELDEFLESMEFHHAIVMIEMALNQAQTNGTFNLSESHVIYKSLEKIKQNENQTSHIRTDNPDGDTH